MKTFTPGKVGSVKKKTVYFCRLEQNHPFIKHSSFRQPVLKFQPLTPPPPSTHTPHPKALAILTVQYCIEKVVNSKY